MTDLLDREAATDSLPASGWQTPPLALSLLQLLASFGSLGAVVSLGLAAWAPGMLLEDSSWVKLLGFSRLQAAEPSVVHRAELRAGLAQFALACTLLGIAASWLTRTLQGQRAAGQRASSQLPLAVALLAYIALWLHVCSPLLAEQNFEGHTYVHQAAAWLRGELHIDRHLHDTVLLGDKRHTVFPPFPALLLLPAVAFFGTSTKTLLFTPLLGALTAYASCVSLIRLKVPPEAAVWCTAALIFGTSVLLVSGSQVDTYFAHLCAIACAMWAWCEVTGRCRGWVVGLLLGATVLSRQLSVLMVPFFLAVVAAPNGLRPADERGDPPRLREAAGRALSTALPVALCLAAYGLLNWARFGDWLDSGYGLLTERGWYKYRAETFGTFHWAYVPSNLLRMFVLGLGLEFEAGSYMQPKLTGFGSSLTFTSPFLYFALAGLAPRSSAWPGSRILYTLAWVCTGAIVVAVLLHKSALGGYQIHGVRYTLDFTPLLFPLAALSIGKSWAQPSGLLARWLIGYSIAAGFVMLHVLPPLITFLRQLPR